VVGTLNSPDITPQGDPPLMLNHLYSISSAKLHEHQCIAHVVVVTVDALQLSGSHSYTFGNASQGGHYGTYYEQGDLAVEKF
jgi:hypothetical protein